MSNFYSDNPDIRYYVEKGADWESLVEVTEYGYRTANGFKSSREATEFYAQVAEMVGELSAEEIAPRAPRLDREESHIVDGEVQEAAAMKEVFEKIRAVDLHRLCLPRELGGLNAPLLLYFLNAELLARADVSVMTHNSFHGGMAMAMLAYSIHEGTTTFDEGKAEITTTRFAKEMDEIARGEAWGCMDITEPNAGSDMAALKSVGEQDEKGQWFVSGQKIFITSGHGKYHFVIARTEKAEAGDNPMAGLAGLSMFLVNTYEDLPDGTRKRYVTIDRVEEKLGHHGSVTAALSFDRAPAQLIGKRGEGFKYMLVLMNNARLGVGFESIGLCESAYRMAKAYAEERRSMGKSVAQHEMIADYLDEMNTDVRALRALAVKGAYHEEMSQKIGIFTKVLGGDKTKLGRFAESLPYHREEARRLTPLLKYLASEKAVEMARRCIQIHGGVGYTKDYGAEKLLRDALVLPIYEGTSQIQSLMVMKDALGSIIKKPKAFVARLAQVRLRSISSRDPLLRRAATIELHALLAQQHLVVKTAAGKIKGLSGVPLAQWPETMRTGWDPKRDFSWAMLHAERLTRLMADAAVVTILAEQAAEHPERRELLVAYVERAELRSKALYEEILRTGGRLLDSLQGATVSENVPHAAQ